MNEPILIIYANGLVIAPGAKAYGELLERFKVAADLAIYAENKMRATPLPKIEKEADVNGK